MKKIFFLFIFLFNFPYLLANEIKFAGEVSDDKTLSVDRIVFNRIKRGIFLSFTASGMLKYIPDDKRIETTARKCENVPPGKHFEVTPLSCKIGMVI